MQGEKESRSSRLQISLKQRLISQVNNRKVKTFKQLIEIVQTLQPKESKQNAFQFLIKGEFKHQKEFSGIVNLFRDYKNIVQKFKIVIEEQKNNPFDQLKGKNVILLLGKTGAGKSTLFNWLGGFKPIKQGKYYRFQQKEAAAVSFQQQSMTKRPQVLQSKDIDQLLIDLPGFMDNKGYIDRIINLNFIKKVISLARKIKVLFVVEKQDLTQTRKTIFQKNLSDLMGLISNERLINKTIHFLPVINKLKDQPEKKEQLEIEQEWNKFFQKKDRILYFQQKPFYVNQLTQSSRKAILQRIKFVRDSKLHFDNHSMHFDQETQNYINKQLKCIQKVWNLGFERLVDSSINSKHDIQKKEKVYQRILQQYKIFITKINPDNFQPFFNVLQEIGILVGQDNYLFKFFKQIIQQGKIFTYFFRINCKKSQLLSSGIAIDMTHTIKISEQYSDIKLQLLRRKEQTRKKNKIKLNEIRAQKKKNQIKSQKEQSMKVHEQFEKYIEQQVQIGQQSAFEVLNNIQGTLQKVINKLKNIQSHLEFPQRFQQFYQIFKVQNFYLEQKLKLQQLIKNHYILMNIKIQLVVNQDIQINSIHQIDQNLNLQQAQPQIVFSLFKIIQLKDGIKLLIQKCSKLAKDKQQKQIQYKILQKNQENIKKSIIPILQINKNKQNKFKEFLERNKLLHAAQNNFAQLSLQKLNQRLIEFIQFQQQLKFNCRYQQYQFTIINSDNTTSYYRSIYLLGHMMKQKRLYSLESLIQQASQCKNNLSPCIDQANKILSENYKIIAEIQKQISIKIQQQRIQQERKSYEQQIIRGATLASVSFVGAISAQAAGVALLGPVGIAIAASGGLYSMYKYYNKPKP